MRPSTATLAILTSLAALPALADGWALIDAIVVEEVEDDRGWRAEKTFPEALRTAETFTVDGYLVPVVPEPYLQTFLVVRDPDDCPFCGSAYGPALEVTLARPMPELAEFARITVTGRLELIEDPGTFQSVRLIDARAEPLD